LKKKTLKFTIFLISAAIITAIAALTSATFQEDALAKYAIEGRVLDKKTGLPLENAEVLLILHEPPPAAGPEMEKLFEKNELNWKYGIEADERNGISDEDGYYRAKGARMYSVKYRSLFGIRKEFKPFDRAWAVFRKEGYEIETMEIKTNQMKKAGPAGGPYNEIGAVYLKKNET